MKHTETKAKSLPHTVIGALADAFGKSFMTIQRWVIRKDIILTTDIAKGVFAEYGIDWNGGEYLEPQDAVHSKL
jgi:hypothetical protein